MKIEHGYRDWKHHLRLKGTGRVKSALHLAGLITAVVVLYWYLCLLGIRCARSHLQGELRSWGGLGYFKAGMELLALGPQLVNPLAHRLLSWLADKLWPYAPPTPTYKLRYRYNQVIP